ncbi:hypothetical protein HPB50_024866 [Hyalomma asiaticum]|uniref:Uncharacterized protein n=2 Tax=Hyalomma asiaticum TaxID=266040 RepID=A0ACB7RKN6_HYAAI|nr:hypothetical protein HPB50_024866 [Hyalomma asiaticum]
MAVSRLALLQQTLTELDAPLQAVQEDRCQKLAEQKLRLKMMEEERECKMLQYEDEKKAFLQDARPSYAAAARCRSVPSRHRGLSAPSKMTDQEQTMGEDAPSESATDDSDWKVVRSRQQRRRQEQFLLNNNAANLTSQHNHQGMKPQRIKGSVIKAGRMPRLPKEHEKVIIRPQGGLNIAQTPTPLLASAILAASGIKREDAKEDILSPNAQQNIVVQVTDQPEQGLIKIQIEDQGSDS